MNDLLNNWLVQAIIGNAVCFILSKILLWFYDGVKNNKKDNEERPLSNYSKKSLRKQFYICFLIIIVSAILLHFFVGQNYLTVICGTAIFLCGHLVVFAFECALDCFDDGISKRSK